MDHLSCIFFYKEIALAILPERNNVIMSRPSFEALIKTDISGEYFHTREISNKMMMCMFEQQIPDKFAKQYLAYVANYVMPPEIDLSPTSYMRMEKTGFLELRLGDYVPSNVLSLWTELSAFAKEHFSFWEKAKMTTIIPKIAKPEFAIELTRCSENPSRLWGHMKIILFFQMPAFGNTIFAFGMPVVFADKKGLPVDECFKKLSDKLAIPTVLIGHVVLPVSNAYRPTDNPVCKALCGIMNEKDYASFVKMNVLSHLIGDQRKIGNSQMTYGKLATLFETHRIYKVDDLKTHCESAIVTLYQQLYKKRSDCFRTKVSLNRPLFSRKIVENEARKNVYENTSRIFLSLQTKTLVQKAIMQNPEYRSICENMVFSTDIQCFILQYLLDRTKMQNSQGYEKIKNEVHCAFTKPLMSQSQNPKQTFNNGNQTINGGVFVNLHINGIIPFSHIADMVTKIGHASGLADCSNKNGSGIKNSQVTKAVSEEIAGVDNLDEAIGTAQVETQSEMSDEEMMAN